MKRSLIGLKSNQYSDEKIIVISFHFNDILNKDLSNWLCTTTCITLIFLDVHGYRMVCLGKHATGGKFGRACNCQQVLEDLKLAADEGKIM